MTTSGNLPGDDHALMVTDDEVLLPAFSTSHLARVNTESAHVDAEMQSLHGGPFDFEIWCNGENPENDPRISCYATDCFTTTLLISVCKITAGVLSNA